MSDIEIIPKSELPATIASSHYLKSFVSIVLVDKNICFVAGCSRRRGRLIHRVSDSSQTSSWRRRSSVRVREIGES